MFCQISQSIDTSKCRVTWIYSRVLVNILSSIFWLRILIKLRLLIWGNRIGGLNTAEYRFPSSNNLRWFSLIELKVILYCWFCTLRGVWANLHHCQQITAVSKAKYLYQKPSMCSHKKWLVRKTRMLRELSISQTVFPQYGIEFHILVQLYLWCMLWSAHAHIYRIQSGQSIDTWQLLVRNVEKNFKWFYDIYLALVMFVCIWHILKMKFVDMLILIMQVIMIK